MIWTGGRLWDESSALRDDSAHGFHAHNNPGAAIANNLEVIKAGADIIDGSLRSFGAGSGKTSTKTIHK
jgi:4-hydroxy 2-oxovalerate aldolase